MDKQIIYLLSTNFAGSHFLALQLGSHDKCLSIGELHHFARRKNRLRACHLCPTDNECPIFKGMESLPVNSLYDKVFENLLDYDRSISTIVDNSKKTEWASRFLELEGYQKKYIHLIRDPRALIRRWLLTEDTNEKKRHVRWVTARRCWKNSLDILTGDEINVYLWKWLYQNKLITDFIEKNHLQSRLVTYHDLVMQPDDVLSGLMEWIGQSYDPRQKEYWSYEHHSSVKKSYMAPPKDGQVTFDLRWKDFLDEDTCQRIVNFEPICKYIDKLGLAWNPEGLIKK